MAVTLRLPSALGELVAGRRTLTYDAATTVRDLLDQVERDHPALGRRVRDETGAVRRFVNVYVGDDDVRHGEGLDTALTDGDVVHVLPSVAGG